MNITGKHFIIAHYCILIAEPHELQLYTENLLVQLPATTWQQIIRLQRLHL